MKLFIRAGYLLSETYPLNRAKRYDSQFRPPCSLVGELGDQEAEGLNAEGDPQRPGVLRLKACVAGQLGGQPLATAVIAAVDEAWLRGVALGREHAEQHLARHVVERGYDPTLA